MESLMRGAVENYRERIRRVALFDVLYRLDSKKTKDKSGKRIDFFNIGLLSLLFFFENRLMRNKKTGLRELAMFLKKTTSKVVELDDNGFMEMAKSVIETFRPPGGKRNMREFYDWEQNRSDSVAFSILKASRHDSKENIQYYTLDEDGLELVFATKEYFSEFQLSINQLLLRKQLEKGEFIGALRQIDEMRIDVETLEERIKKIKHEVLQNILSEKTYERYKKLIDDINMRLVRENEEFDELQSFTMETKKKLSYDIKDKKDRKTYEYAVRISNELSKVHSIHKTLLKKSIELKTSTLEAASESLYHMGIESFNFKKEIVSRVFSSPLPLEPVRVLIEPFLYVEKKVMWSPVTVFGSQRLERNKKGDITREFLEVKNEDDVLKEKLEQQEKFREIMDLVLESLDFGFETRLSKVIEHAGMKKPKLLDERYFYHFFMILHQKSPIDLAATSSESEMTLESAIYGMKGDFKYLNVEELESVIDVCGKYQVMDMKIVLEGNDGLL